MVEDFGVERGLKISVFTVFRKAAYREALLLGGVIGLVEVLCRLRAFAYGFSEFRAWGLCPGL